MGNKFLNKQLTSNLDWPGWPILDNPYGKDFDLDARKRMVDGSLKLLPFLNKYKNKMGKVILEVGPFFNPLVTPERFPNKHIFYWENDHHVLQFLAKNYNDNKTHAMFCDLNHIDGPSLLKLKSQTLKHFKTLGYEEVKFDVIVASHVFNYIDYRLFLMVVKDFLKKDGLLFINNVVNYGLPDFFSEQRPKSIPETLQTIKQTGYVIIDKTILDSPYPKYQRNKRLLVVARND